MSVQRPDRHVPPAGAEWTEPVRELDRVRVLLPVMGDDDLTVPAGATGTVVAVYTDGAAFEVEFTEPFDTLATIDAAAVRLVERAVR
ncbi:DUF4926 domain-containing protein [Methylobacterium sp. GC_Met_2]|uniref:DUF4926 domain-containing protein n=1 Tax=Methylobacterium sp. GC_Met_2 TaxID=2937376 RepID=UPI00226B1815|nr:DUF4926 domain-containing protein [Methylobacterium sp. GC_Met_2]